MSHDMRRPNNAQNAIRCLPNAVVIRPSTKLSTLHWRLMSHDIRRVNNAQNASRCLPNDNETLLSLNSALCIGDLCHTICVDLTMHKMQFGVYQTLL